MITFGFLILFASIAFVSCDDEASASGLSPEEMKAIQEKVDKLQIIEDVIKSFLKPESAIEEREEKCLPLGSVCSFTSGPRCCTIRARCFIWDRLEHVGKRGHQMKWVSHCKEYNGGRWVDEIGKFFKNLG